MTATTTASLLIRLFEAQDAPVFGGQQPARRALARRLGVATGTLKSAREGRLKRICADFFAALKREELRRLNLEIAKAEASLAVVRTLGLHPDDPEIRAAEAVVAAAKSHAGVMS